MLLITGINGFIGTHIAHRFRQADRPVRGLVREDRQEPQIEYLKSIGVEIVRGDPACDQAWRNAMQGMTHVAHLVGSVQPPRGTTFEAMHVGLSRKCLDAAEAAGIDRVLFVSAINARPGGVSRYYDTKGRAEELFRSSRISHNIVRPALVCGRSVGHRNSKVMMKFLDMAACRSAFRTVGNGQNRAQPLHVDDLAECVFQIVTDDARAGKEFDLAGPDVLALDDLIGRIAARAGCPEKPIRHVPRWLARIVASIAEHTSDTPILTTDQIRTMREDMVADPDTIQREFGFKPRSFDEALEDYFGDSDGEQVAPE